MTHHSLKTEFFFVHISYFYLLLMWIQALVSLGLAPLLYLWFKFWNFFASPFVPEFVSSFPIRNDSNVKWFVDGQDYMSAVADAIEAAKQEILITAWQMNPYIFMKRPNDGVDSLKWRLDKMLIRKADEGVRVYILLYWETQKALDLGSNDTESVLTSHPNIVVYRHPNYLTLIQNPSTIMWSHHEKLVIVDRSVAFVGGIDLCYGRWDTHDHELMDNYQIHPSASKDCGNRNQEANYRYSRWIGKDYKNIFFSSESNIDWGKPYDDYDYVDRSKIPRMPWHDVACAFTGDAVSDVVKHFIQRYNAINPTHSKLRYLPTELDATEYNIPHHSSYTKAKVQVLRSVSEWSAGQPHEASIYSAYLRVIENAKHYIYIENQFFISSRHDVKNLILLTLVERIYCAYKKNADFHVMIVMPLKQEFGPEDWNQSFLNIGSVGVSYWNYVTLFNRENSLVHKLVEKGMPRDSIKKYLSVYGLRTHDMLGEKLATEIIYVHSKLMIVDDRITIIGSANINDRSMLGNQNSEVAVIVEDVEMIEIKMNDCQHQAGKFAHTMRCFLHEEHLGLLNSQRNRMKTLNVTDPLNSSIISDILKQARQNTQIYERVFGSRILPTNQVKNYDDLEKWKEEKDFVDTDERLAKDELQHVRGNIVEFPDRFLRDELIKAPRVDYTHIQKGTEALKELPH